MSQTPPNPSPSASPSQAGEPRFRAVFENIGVGMSVVDRDGRFLAANAVLQNMFGYTSAELSEMTFSQVTHPDDAARTLELYRAMVERGIDRYQTEKRYVHKDGRTVWGNVIVSIVRDERGEVDYSIGLVEDITERKTAEAALRESEQRYRTLFQATPTGLLVEDDRGFIVDVNHAVERMVGRDRGELIGRHVSVLNPGYEHAAQANIDRVLAGETLCHEVVNQHADGSDRIIELIETRISLPDGRPGILVVSQDVTERRRADQALRENQYRLDMTIQGANLGVWDWDLRTGEVRYDQRWAGALSLVMVDMPATYESWAATLHPDDRAETLAALRAMLDGEAEVYRSVFRLRKKDGRWRWFLSHGRIVDRDAEGQPTRVVGILQDIDETKRAELALRASEKQTRRLAERLQVLLGELDHRVRNNLAGLATLVSMYAQGKPEVRQFARAVEGKLMAMKRVHELIATGDYRSVEFEQLVGDLRGMFGVSPGAWCVTCPQLWITPRQAAPLAMVLHEMLTNSHKHGALSIGVGAIDVVGVIEAETDDAVRVRLDWKEQGANGTPPDDSTGQGLQLIRGLVEFDLRGASRFDFTPDGMRCRLVVELDKPKHV